MMKIKEGEVYEFFSQAEDVRYYFYPFATMELTVPVRVEKEYNRYYLCTVLPHDNPKGYGKSLPYHITVHKHDLVNGWCKFGRVVSPENA